MRTLTYVIFALIVISCNNPEIEKLKGTWAIDSIEENGHDQMFMYLSNLITFEKEYECSIPQLRGGSNTIGKWMLYKENEICYIEIEVEGNKLSGKYKIDFKRDAEKQLLRMELSFSNTKIVCSKLLYNFND